MRIENLWSPRSLSALALLLGTAAAPSPGSGQFLPLQAGAGAGYERYTFNNAESVGIESVSLTTFPFAGRVVLPRDITLELGGSFAQGTLVRVDGSSVSISGPTDTELRASVPFERNGVTVSLIGAVILPTGNQSHTREEAAVAGVIAADLLPFRISNWGSGGGAALGASIARPFGAVNLGLNAGYRVAGEFEPLQDAEFAYRPGNEFRVRFAADRTFDRGSKVSAQVSLFTYGDDQLQGTNLFRSGTRVQLVGSYAFPMQVGSSAVVYAGMLHRAQGAALDEFLIGSSAELEDIPAQTLLLLGSAARVPSGIGTIIPAVDVRAFRREDGLGQGWLVGLGASNEARMAGGGLTLAPSLRLRFGNLMVADETESAFVGTEVGLTVRFGPSSP